MENTLYLSTRFSREIVIERERQTSVNNVRRRIKAVEIDRTNILAKKEREKKKDSAYRSTIGDSERSDTHIIFSFCIVLCSGFKNENEQHDTKKRTREIQLKGKNKTLFDT